METTPDMEARQKDKDSDPKMKAYADQKRKINFKPHNLNAEDNTLVKQRRLNKASPHSNLLWGTQENPHFHNSTSRCLITEKSVS